MTIHAHNHTFKIINGKMYTLVEGLSYPKWIEIDFDLKVGDGKIK